MDEREEDAGAGPEEGGDSILRTLLKVVLGIGVFVGVVGVRSYRAWQKVQPAEPPRSALPPDAIPLRLLQGANAPTAARPPWKMPALPAMGDATRLEPGVAFREVHLPGGERPGHPLAIPGHSGKLWLYLPEGDHATGSLPCVLIAAAGSNLITGMALGDGDRPEHLPYARAGFAVLAYELDGMLPDPPPENVAALGPYIRSFVDAEAGLVNMRVALEFATTRVPAIDPKRIYAVGHSSAATLALLVAENEPRIAACVAYAPVVDLNERLPSAVRESAAFVVPGADRLFTRLNPRNGEANIRGPLFLFYAKDDPEARQLDEFARRIMASKTPATVGTVRSGGHYEPMIRTGIPRAIAWLKSLRPTPNGLRPAQKKEPAPRAKREKADGPRPSKPGDPNDPAPGPSRK